MPAIKCNNGNWKWGKRGNCVYATKQKAEKAGQASKLINKSKTRKKK